MRRCLIAAALILALRASRRGRTRAEASGSRTGSTATAHWSIEIITEDGPCDRAYRYAVRIERGQARFIGGGLRRSGQRRRQRRRAGLDLRTGRPPPTSPAASAANGFGAGTWAATGAPRCRGRWNAERRG